MSLKIGDYIFTRLRQLGIGSVFGVPGDYNLRLLDFVDPSGLHWVGNCNELNAAYAADAYARINGLSALVTTFGVGELSAINAIAGAYTEKAPIIHIVGTPGRASQDSGALLHHTLGDKSYRHFAEMAVHVTVAQANLIDPRVVPDQIDWLLKEAIIHSRPVYLEIPDDMVHVLVSDSNLKTKIEIPSAPLAEHESKVLDLVLERIYNAQKPLIHVDGDIRPMGIVEEVEELVKLTNWPTWLSNFSKGLINEQLPNVYGIYNGALGDPQRKEYFESADLIIALGPHYTDTNTAIFRAVPRASVSVAFSPGTIKIGDEIHRDISAKFIRELLKALDSGRIPKVTGPPKSTTSTKEDLDPSGIITQKHFWRVANGLFRENDLVLAETGTSSHGGYTFDLPPKSRFFGSVTWLSIGYMLPATLGATIAQRELTNSEARSFLFVGDGSLQMSVQELSTIIREKLNVIVFVINNDGYTIERAIHGRTQAYNSVAAWRHPLAMSFFGADEDHAKNNNFVARNWGELDEILKHDNIQNGKGLRMVEVFMERDDVIGALIPLMQQRIANGD